MESDQSNKRQRKVPDEDDGGEAPARRDEAAFDVGIGWQRLVLRLGERCAEFDGRSDPAEQIELTASVLKRNFEGIRGDLLPLLMQCAEEIPHKAPYYMTLVGLLNADFEELGRSVVDHVYSGLQAGLDTGECNKIRILLRLLTLLMCNKVVTPAAVLAAYTDFITAALNTPLDPAAVGNDDTAMEDAQEQDSLLPKPGVSPNQPRADFLVFSVLAALPFGAPELEKDSASELEEVLSAAQGYMDARRPLQLPALVPLAQQADAVPAKDYLQDLWDRVLAMKEDSWAAASVPTPQDSFLEQLQGSEHPPHAGAPLMVPEVTFLPEEDSTPVSLGRAFFSALQRFPPRVSHFRLFPASKTDETMSPIDRFILEEYIVDILFYLNGCRKECTGYLVGLPVTFSYDYVLAEVIFSQLLLLPKPPFPLVYYTVVLVDLCKALPGAFPAVLASAVRLLFSKMPLMDTECRHRIVQWMAHHLSNFAFVWPWEAWAAVAKQPDWSPQRMFAAEVLEKEVRLAYPEKIKESLKSEAMEDLLPPQSKPAFAYGHARKGAQGSKETERNGEKDTANGEVDADGEKAVSDQERQLAQKLIDLVKRRTPAREVVSWSDAELLGLEPSRAVDLVIQTLLVLGSKSITHSSTVLERYCSVLNKLAPDQASQAALVQSVVHLWASSPQMAAVLVDRLMALRIVSNLAIVDWVFSPSNFPAFHSSDRVWEILRNAISKTANRVQDLTRDVSNLKRSAAAASALAVRAKAEAVEAAQLAATDESWASKASLAQAEVAKLEEEATTAEETVEAKVALLRRAEKEQEALFSATLLHFSKAVELRLKGSEDAEMAGESTADEEEAQADGEGKQRRRKRTRLEEVEEKEWLRCTLGMLRSLCRLYAQQVWQMMGALQSSTLPSLRPDVLNAMKDGILLPKS